MKRKELIKELKHNIGYRCYCVYKIYGGSTVAFEFIPKLVTDNGTKSKMYVVPENDTVYLRDKDSFKFTIPQNFHKYNWLGLIDVKDIEHFSIK